MRQLLLVFLTLVTTATYALHVECASGVVATQVIHQGDTIFVFAKEVEMQTTDGKPVSWFHADGTLAQSNTASAYLDDGGYYIEYGGNKEYFVVFAYPNYQPKNLTLEVEPSCNNTTLILKGDIPTMNYQTMEGKTRTLERTCDLSYTNLAWDNENQHWADSLARQDNQDFKIGEYLLPAIYCSTQVVLTYDPLAEKLNLSKDSLFVYLEEPVAITAHPTSATSTRGEAGELSNEVERPTDASILEGSAPLDILFKANPTPAVEFYDWSIYKEREQLAVRTDEEQRYVFNEPGVYRVVCKVRSTRCPCQEVDNPDCVQDSTEFTIAVSESMLKVPNVFTPNGDGKNDEFRVLYRSLREFHCWVYNRWGKLVYEWTDPAKGWDGTINGRPAAEGAYFYVIRAMGTDAAPNAHYIPKIKYNKEKDKAPESILGIYQISGDINLIRGK